MMDRYIGLLSLTLLCALMPYVQGGLVVPADDPHEYYVAFIDPVNNPDDANPHLVLVAQSTADVTVTSWNDTMIDSFTLAAGTAQTVNISSSLLANSGKETKGILIDSTAPLTVFANNARFQNGDVAHVMRMRMAFKKFLIPAFTYMKSSGNDSSVSKFTVVAGQDETKVRMTFHDGDGCNGPSATVVRKTLDRLQTFTRTAKSDLTGTCISASNPVAVFAGSTAFVPVTGPLEDPKFLYEQVLPTSLLGKQHTLPDFISRTSAGDIYRVIASEDATTVTVYIGDQPVQYGTKLQKGQFHQFSTGTENRGHVICSKPCMVVMYNARSDIDGDATAAFMTAIPSNSKMMQSAYLMKFGNYQGDSFDTNRLSLVTPISATISKEGTPLSQTPVVVKGTLNIGTIERGIGSSDPLLFTSDDRFMAYLYSSSADDAIGTHGGINDDVEYCQPSPCTSGQTCLSYCPTGVTSGCASSINDGYLCSGSEAFQGYIVAPANIKAYINGDQNQVYLKTITESGDAPWPNVGKPMSIPGDATMVAFRLSKFRKPRVVSKTMGFLAAFTDVKLTHSGKPEKFRCLAANDPYIIESQTPWYSPDFQDSLWVRPEVKSDHPGAAGSGFEIPLIEKILEMSNNGSQWLWPKNWGKSTRVYCRLYF